MPIILYNLTPGKFHCLGKKSAKSALALPFAVPQSCESLRLCGGILRNQARSSV